MSGVGLPPRTTEYFPAPGRPRPVSAGGTGAKDSHEARRSLVTAPADGYYLVAKAHQELPNATDLSGFADGLISVSAGALVTASALPTGLPFIAYDSTFTIVDQADVSKVLGFSLGGGAAGKTLTLVSSPTQNISVTLPDGGGFSYTVAGADIDNTWAGTQDYVSGGAEILIEADNFCLYDSTGVFCAIIGYGAGANRNYQLPLVTYSNPLFPTFATYEAHTTAGDAAITGDLMYGKTGEPFKLLSIGAAGTVLTVSAGLPAWATVASLVDVTRTWSTLQTFKDTTWKVVDDADATKTVSWSLGGATTGADLTLLWTGASDISVTMPSSTGTLALTADIDGARTWATLQKFKDTTFLIGDDGDITKALNFSLGGATTGKTMTLLAAHAADVTITMPPATCALAAYNRVQTWTASQTVDSDAGGELNFKQTSSSGSFGFNVTEVASGRKFQFDIAAQTVGDGIAFLPNLAGTSDTFAMLALAQSFSSKTNGVSCSARVSTSATGFALVDQTTTSKIQRFIQSTMTASVTSTITNRDTAARDHEFQNQGGAMVTVGVEASAPTTDTLGTYNVTGRTTAIGSTNLTNTPGAGLYRVSYHLAATAADVTAGTIQLTVSYTDDVGATTQTSAALVLTATGRDRGTFVVWLASGQISFSTTLTGVIGTSTYALHIRVESLGP